MSENQIRETAELMYIGSYGPADQPTIHVCQLSDSGKLEIIQAFNGVSNPSYLALHPEAHRLYAVQEIEETNQEPGGSVVSISIDSQSGLLQRIEQTASSVGAHPCYVSVLSNKKGIVAANYTEGNIAVVPIDVDGRFTDAGAIAQHGEGSGVVADRQAAAHAHCALSMPGTDYISAVDLGMDAIITQRYDAIENRLIQQQVCKLHGGAGPRHLVFHQTLPIAYVANELDSSITILQVDKQHGSLEVVNTVSTLPEGYKEYNDSADIHLSSCGRYLYSSNRGHNSIAVFEIDQETGQLLSIQHISCGGELPRNFALSRSGRFLLVANAKTGNVVVFKVDASSGLLTATVHEIDLPSPVCIRFSQKVV